MPEIPADLDLDDAIDVEGRDRDPINLIPDPPAYEPGDVITGPHSPILLPTEARVAPSVTGNFSMARRPNGARCIRIQLGNAAYLDLTAWELAQVVRDAPPAIEQIANVRQAGGFDE